MFLLTRNLFFILTLGLVPTASVSESLKDAIAKSIFESPRVLARQYHLKGVEETLKARKAALLPTVELSADVDTTNPIGNSGSAGANSENSMKLELVLKKNIYDGRFQKNKIAEQQSHLSSDIYRVKAEQEIIALEISQKYLNVLKKEQIYKMTKDFHKEAIEIHQQAKARLKAGITSIIEFDRIGLRLAKTEANYHSALNNYLVSKAEYKAYTGTNPNPTMPRNIPLEFIPKSFDLALQTAIKKHPTQFVCKYEIEKARAIYEASLSITRPKVDLSLNANVGNNVNLYGNTNRELGAKLTATWTLFNGNKTKHLSSASKYDLQKVQANCDQNLRKIEINLNLSWVAFESLFEKSTAVANQVKSAERLEPIIRKRYETNLSSLEELFQANIDVFESKRDLVINNYDLQSTEYRLLQGTGELLDYFKFKKLPSL